MAEKAKKAVTLAFVVEKETKNTVRFAEVVPKGGFAHVGALYVQNAALSNMGFEEGQTLEVTINIKQAS